MNDDNKLLEDLLHWIDSIPLSRPKKNLARDFSDGGTYKIIWYKNKFSFIGRNNKILHSSVYRIT